MSTLQLGLGAHGRAGAVPRPGHLPLGVHAQQVQQRHLSGVVEVHRPVGLGQPQLHAVLDEGGGQLFELLAVESAFVLADDDR
ncbi:hypothetical protein OG799_16285 [Micromonospora sp. NBC_00898]|uniref:hypothetical protein n=1 Tax=Micromonospora sp. NBC_00898 TaxID=2975981 RepID=UPI003866E7D6|nr:hypothetical protein OG799_16285 [Micromonospora sp. NBC_00898]